MLKDIARALAGVAALGIAASLGGCDDANVQFDMDGGVPLSQLDLSGKAPGEVALLGPDAVNITEGKKLAIDVTGDDDAKNRLRFKIDDGTLSIAREKGFFSNSEGVATINLTMPAPRKLVMAGSGKVTAAAMKGEKASIVIAGSGKVSVAKIKADRLKVDVAGSGSVNGSGNVKTLKMTIAGSGDADLSGLSAESADVNIAGSGDARFASDGDVSAKIMGSGEVRVAGRATCTVKSMGSGKLVCENGAVKDSGD
ncbi:head GIN domain-containing protein [Novosphingobium sp. ZN18A2]|uniref:head GIN domain-containing protein n=1 Tax=Novosphingobium sp. ZN18A2 TaxID=3079861 RepID=UPI0030D0110F